MRGQRALLTAVFILSLPLNLSYGWNDNTHMAIAKAAEFKQWYNVNGADMAKIKAGDIEAHNHYVNNPPGTPVTPEMVLAQAEKYNRVDEDGHLYGAIIASFRDHIREREKAKIGAYHLAFCAHYVGDLSQPLHNTLYNTFNKRFHATFDEMIEDEVLHNLDKIRVYPIRIDSERSLAFEIARIANLSTNLGLELEAQNRVMSKAEAYEQISHSASLLRAILDYLQLSVESRLE